MHIDAQTFAELDVFRSANGGHSLFDLLDRTRTPGGRAVLKRRFLEPVSDPVRIRSIQASLTYIAAQRPLFEALPNARESTALDSYLRSNAETSAGGSRWARFWEVVSYEILAPEVIRDIGTGVHLLCRLLARLEPMIRSLAADLPPDELRGLVAAMADVVHPPDSPPGLHGDGIRQLGQSQCMAIDRYVRGAARDRFLRLAELTDEIAALVSMSDANQEMGWTFPDLADGPPRFEATGLYHPLVDGAVANTIRAEPHHQLMFLTGPNMAGKTTFLKACALAAYLAHLGMGVPASELRLTPFDVLFSGLNTVDSLRDGVSYYLAEVRRVREAAEILATHRPSLIVFDELFKGTNVKDAFDACMIVLQGFLRFPTGLCLVSSHLIELAEPLSLAPGVVFGSFEAHLADDGLHFDYRLRPGTSDQRLGLAILLQEGIPEILLPKPAP